MARKSVTKTIEINSPSMGAPIPPHPHDRLNWRLEQHDGGGRAVGRELRHVEEIATAISGINGLSTLLRNQESIQARNSAVDSASDREPVFSPCMIEHLHDAMEILVNCCQVNIERLETLTAKREGQ